MTSKRKLKNKVEGLEKENDVNEGSEVIRFNKSVVEKDEDGELVTVNEWVEEKDLKTSEMKVVEGERPY